MRRRLVWVVVLLAVLVLSRINWPQRREAGPIGSGRLMQPADALGQVTEVSPRSETSVVLQYRLTPGKGMLPEAVFGIEYRRVK